MIHEMDIEHILCLQQLLWLLLLLCVENIELDAAVHFIMPCLDWGTLDPPMGMILRANFHL